MVTLPGGGGPLSQRRERIVQWLVTLQRVDPQRFAVLPGAKDDPTESQREALTAVFWEMQRAGYYGSTKPYELPMRLMSLRWLVSEARRRRGLR